MTARRRYDLVLAIYPNTRGFGFVLFEGPLAPLDWAVVEVRGKNKNRECLKRTQMIFNRYHPETLVLQDMSYREKGARRARRVRELNDAIASLAEGQGIPIVAYSRASVRGKFAEYGLPTKQLIAEAIAKHIPEFDRYVPDIRKPWMSEDARMGLFDACALALTHFEQTIRP